jgi:hypothetical protein
MTARLSSRPPRPRPRPQPVQDHTYTLPHVVEVPRPVGPDTFDETVW